MSMILMIVRALSIFPCIAAIFVHPGLLVTNIDIERIKAQLAVDKEPWTSSWDLLTSSTYASSSYTPNNMAIIYRGTDGVNADNAAMLWHDAAASFNLALRWKVTGNVQFADTAVKILNAWGETLSALEGSDDRYLSAGLQGHEMANAAELLRDYSGWTTEARATFNSMMVDVFLTNNMYFLNHQAPSQHNVQHFHANWELANMASAMAIGILTDNETAYNYVVDYYKNGTGNGATNLLINNIVAEPNTGAKIGQGQESGRDQGHSLLDWQMVGVIGQQAWNQGEDYFGWNDSKILKGLEYFARYNLGYDVPFVQYTNGIVSHSEISNASRGCIRPTWELLYNHFVVVKGMDAPWTSKYLNFTLEGFGGFEPGAGAWGEGSGHYDSLGWGSLLYRSAHDDNSSRAQTISTMNIPSISSPISKSWSSIIADAPHQSESPTTAYVDTSTAESYTVTSGRSIEPVGSVHAINVTASNTSTSIITFAQSAATHSRSTTDHNAAPTSNYDTLYLHTLTTTNKEHLQGLPSQPHGTAGTRTHHHGEDHFAKDTVRVPTTKVSPPDTKPGTISHPRETYISLDNCQIRYVYHDVEFTSEGEWRRWMERQGM